MTGIVARDRLLSDLRAAFDAIEAGTVIVHTDLRTIGIVDRVQPPEQALQSHMEVLLEAAGGRTLVVPTFNYDFLRTGRYDVDGDPCQVGALNEHIRRRHPGRRTRTPVFNFVVLGDGGPGPAPARYPLGDGSAFDTLVDDGAAVTLLGTDVSRDTLFHHIEERLAVPYRYPKRFEGVIVEGGDEAPFWVEYRVKPLIDGEIGVGVVYDWDRLNAELLEHGVMRTAPVGRGLLLRHDARTLVDHWSAALGDDPLHLLTAESRDRVASLFREYGRPLTRVAVEGGGSEPGAGHAEPSAAPRRGPGTGAAP